MAMYVALEGTDHEVRTGVWVTSVSTGLMIVPTSQKQATSTIAHLEYR